MSTTDLADISERLAAFVRERDWDQFHSPKNLATALSVEAAELLEHFQWLTEAESKALTEKQTAAVADEIADVQIYLLMLANKVGVDVPHAVTAKIEKNEQKHPVSTSKGVAPSRHP